MSEYTICPSFIELAKINKKFINDILMVFVPDNSKTICIDNNEMILKEYDSIIKTDKDLIDWYKFLTMRKDSNFTKVNIDKEFKSLPLQICENSYDKILITDDKAKYIKFKSEITKKGIQILDKNIAKIQLNYGIEGFPQTSKSFFEVVTPDNLFQIVMEICKEFKDVIENKGLFKLLVNSAGVRVSENEAQLLFFGVAHSHCKANNLKLSPEVNSGNGPVDFNISIGFKANVNVEMKFADNPKLDQGLFSQLKIYNLAENASNSIYLILKTNDVHDKKITKLKEVLKYRKAKGEFLPEIFVIDSAFKVSASVRM